METRRDFVADRPGRAFIEHHHDVACKRELHVHGGFGSEAVGIAVQVRLEGDALFSDSAQTGEAEDLKAAGIGEYGAGPRHEFVQSAELPDGSWPGLR